VRHSASSLPLRSPDLSLDRRQSFKKSCFVPFSLLQPTCHHDPPASSTALIFLAARLSASLSFFLPCLLLNLETSPYATISFFFFLLFSTRVPILLLHLSLAVFPRVRPIRFPFRCFPSCTEVALLRKKLSAFGARSVLRTLLSFDSCFQFVCPTLPLSLCLFPFLFPSIATDANLFPPSSIDYSKLRQRSPPTCPPTSHAPHKPPPRPTIRNPPPFFPLATPAIVPLSQGDE